MNKLNGQRGNQPAPSPPTRRVAASGGEGRGWGCWLAVKLIHLPGKLAGVVGNHGNVCIHKEGSCLAPLAPRARPGRSTKNMKLKRKKQANTEIDVGSFSDIAFLLIIFFILTSTFTKIAGNKIEIPSGSEEQSEVEQKQISVTLSAENITYGEDAKSMSIDELRVALAKEKFETKEPEDRMVVLETGGEVLYERYFQVVMAINDADGVLTLIDHAGGEDEQ